MALVNKSGPNMHINGTLSALEVLTAGLKVAAAQDVKLSVKSFIPY